ncbi:glycosyltransferase [Allomesorhizobium camelthorni]|uniref:Glycosyltransferase n=1 Tax=Allomesorhizobium camelthorni TaxID=475069 RepID=A0A6G4WCA1_9HYPH|nr:glycosyltransferase [Mesorhizobium camelthorni]NGO52229.1 glycosyltransferase [Mesorhizobium camelthorni]
MKESILSVVMPCLNGMPHLPAAIESVKSVLSGDSHEIIVADGGSTDGTLDYLRNAGVTLIEKPDRSLYEGLNNAISLAHGQYIAWLNSDDLLLGGVADLWRKAREGQADIVTGEAEIASDGKVVWRSDHHVGPMSPASILFAVPTVNSRLMHTGLLQAAGPFPCDIGLGADRYMLLKLLRLAGRRTFQPSTAYRYNSHSGSKTMAATWKSYRDVHDANLRMTRALRDEASGQDERGLIDAFASLSGLAAARAAFFGGEPIKAMGDGLAAFRDNPSPANWYRGLSLYRHYRGHGSGW